MLNLNPIKITSCILLAMLAFAACNNTQQEQNLKALNEQDSVLLVQAQKKDSTISSYIRSMNEIQDNLDSIKQREKILSIRSSEGRRTSAVVITDIKALDALMLKNNREIVAMEAKLKKLDKKDANLDKMVAHLTRELAERDSDIVTLQSKLSQANFSMQSLTRQFNDSMESMSFEKAANNYMREEITTVYYAIGTMKELKKKGVIDKKGGFIGIGRTAQLKQNFNSSYFTKADMTKLNVIPLYAKFAKVITEQPNNAFKVQGNATSDSLLITNASVFWSESKYLVIVVK